MNGFLALKYFFIRNLPIRTSLRPFRALLMRSFKAAPLTRGVAFTLTLYFPVLFFIARCFFY
jgi:hypothetical protein